MKTYIAWVESRIEVQADSEEEAKIKIKERISEIDTFEIVCREDLASGGLTQYFTAGQTTL